MLLSVAYLINQYPKVSHTFVRREIQAIEELEIAVVRFAVRGWDAEPVDAQDLDERDRTRYLLQGGAGALLAAVCRLALIAPTRMLRALGMAVRLGRRAERPLWIHLIYLAEACRLTLWLKEAEVRHVHAHFGTNATEVALLACCLDDFTYSFTVHGPEEFDKPVQAHLPEKIRQAAFVVAISSFGRSQLYRWTDSAHWSKISVIHCGLERAFYENQPVAVEPSRRFVCVGRLCEQKGQLLLLEAARCLQEKNVVFELVLAGDGEMRHELEARIAQHALHDRVRITGWISSEQVRNELIAARAMVLPSFAEGLPVVIMEAMALQRPVLSTYVAGIPELVVPQETGWLFPAGAIDELAQAMEDCLARQPELLRAMGVAARARVIDRHAIETEAAKLAALFRAVNASGVPEGGVRA